MPRHTSISALPVALSLGLAACADLNRLAPTTGARLSGIDTTSSAAPTPSPAPDATPSPAAPPASFGFKATGLPGVTRRIELELASGDTIVASTSFATDNLGGGLAWPLELIPRASLSLTARALDANRVMTLATASVVPATVGWPSVDLAFQPTVYRFAEIGRAHV
mgnify:CR=1 FL=1